MIQQMTKLTVKQPTPQAPTPARPAQDSDKNPTGTYKLTYINTESDKSDTSMPDAASPLHQTTHRGVTEKDPDITMYDASPFIHQVTHRSLTAQYHHAGRARTEKIYHSPHGPCICFRFERIGPIRCNE
ncbi:hypothetical protein E4U46_002610 [Claviceps purpurea]|nr:hypothetical protein E4U28_000282 [Claviceps purpurea]KAG6289372.1 hypothetical protein E4U46_002610 [Claviceps purpurea]